MRRFCLFIVNARPGHGRAKCRVLLSCAILLVVRMGSVYAEASDTAGHTDVELLQVGIQFVAPVGWRKMAPRPDVVSFMDPQKGIIIVMRPRDENPISVQGAWILMRLFKHASEETRTFLGVPAHVFVYNERGSRRGNLVKVKSYEFVTGGKFYCISYVSPPDKFERYLPEFEQALATFELRPEYLR